jgi:hypothetical protein
MLVHEVGVQRRVATRRAAHRESTGLDMDPEWRDAHGWVAAKADAKHVKVVHKEHAREALDELGREAGGGRVRDATLQKQLYFFLVVAYTPKARTCGLHPWSHRRARSPIQRPTAREGRTGTTPWPVAQHSMGTRMGHPSRISRGGRPQSAMEGHRRLRRRAKPNQRRVKPESDRKRETTKEHQRMP